MSRLHIFIADSQPATNWIDPHAPAGYKRHRWNPHMLVTCWNCRRTRQARNARIKVYYDALHVFCADADGCRKATLKRPR